jgi:hypothetical protein
MRISNIRVILEIFIAEARFLGPKPIANRMAGNRKSWPRKKADPRPDLTAGVQETTEPYLNSWSSRAVGPPARVGGGSLAKPFAGRKWCYLPNHYDQCKIAFELLTINY